MDKNGMQEPKYIYNNSRTCKTQKKKKSEKLSRTDAFCSDLTNAIKTFTS